MVPSAAKTLDRMPEGASEGLGNLISRYRKYKHWTQKNLATEMHRSVSWVCQVERNEIKVNQVDQLIRLGEVLGIPRDELVEASLGPEKVESLRQQSYIVEVRKALAGHPVPQLFSDAARTAKITVDFSSIGERIKKAWEFIHSSEYQELGPLLAKLILDLENASRISGYPDQSSSLPYLADAYQIAAAMLVKVGDTGAGWIAADRAITVGERCNDPGLILAGQHRLGRTLLDSKDRVLGQYVLEQGIKMVDNEKFSQDPGLASLVGACWLILSIIHARDHNRDKARQSLDAARNIAKRLGSDRNDYGTEFGPTNVAMHEVSVAVELGEGQTALDKAKYVPGSALSHERQARYLIDVARANVLTGKPNEAIMVLLRAEQYSLQELSHLPLVATVIDDIEHQLKHKKRPPELRKLKNRLYG